MVGVLGSHLINGFVHFDDFMAMLFRTLVGIFIPPFRFSEVLRQIEFIAWESLPIIGFCVSFAAVVTIMESSFHMMMVIQNDSMVPGFAAMLILRELGAVVMALLVTSRVGAGIAAEIGSMQVTEQVDALKMLNIDPIRFLVVPRLIASTISGFCLSIIANMVCLFFAMEISTIELGFTEGAFITAVKTFVGLKDLWFAGIKGAVFGAVIPLVSCYYGFKCKAGAEGVGLATTNSVVTASVAIIIFDFILSFTFSFFY